MDRISDSGSEDSSSNLLEGTMIMKNKTLKYILFYLLIGLVIFPLIQQLYPFLRVEKLYGEFKEEVKPAFSFNHWFSADFQNHYEKNINDEIGFKPFFVRTYNQLSYSIFSLSSAKDFVLGKQGYLYGINYIDSYQGKDYLGDEILDISFERLAKLNDTLLSLNKKLILILAPSKARVLSQYLPNRYSTKQDIKTNYDEIANRLSKTNVSYLDFNKYFQVNNESSKYPLMNKTGVHWTKYGEIISMDSIVKYVSLIAKVNLPKIKYDTLVLTNIPQHSDGDIIKVMNLFYENRDQRLAYPQLHIETSKADKKRPRLLVVGDSFYWGMYYNGLQDKIFDRGEFWYYFKTIYPEDYIEGKAVNREVGQMDIKKELDKFDIIISMQTEVNLPSFGIGFINKLYSIYFPDDKSDRYINLKLEFYKKMIRENKTLMKLIHIKSKEQNISIEQAIFNDAIYFQKLERGESN